MLYYYNALSSTFAARVLYVLLLAGSLSGSQCTTEEVAEEVEDCGDPGTWQMGTYRTIMTLDFRFTPPRRIVRIQPDTYPDGICSDEHVSAEWDLPFTGTPPESITASAHASFGGYGERYPMYVSSNAWIGTGTFGLKQAFPEGSGYVSLSMEVSFPSTGSEQEDAQYFSSLFVSPAIRLSYRQAKS